MVKKPARPRLGRPPKPPSELRDRKLEIRLTAAERAALDAAAAGNVSTWAREQLLRLARR